MAFAMSIRPTILITANEVMAALGGTKAVANLTGRKYSAAQNWRDSQFPANTYFVMSGALAAQGKTAPPSLWGMKIPAEAQS